MIYNLYSRLIYENTIAGYRVFLDGTYYDLDVEFYTILEYDNLIKPNKEYTIDEYLVDMGNTLATQSEITGVINSRQIACKEDLIQLYRKIDVRGISFVANSDLHLRYKFILFNSKYFNNELSNKVMIYYNNRLKSPAGRFRWKNGNKYIEINPTYARNNPNDIDDTIIHEMIHYELPLKEGHGSLFKAEARRINRLDSNVNITTRYDSEKMNIDYKYSLVCYNCGKVYNYMRKMNPNRYHCGECGGKLKLELYRG